MRLPSATLVLIAALTIPCVVFAEGEPIGVSVSGTFSFSSPRTNFDNEGDTTEFPEEFTNDYYLLNLGARYRIPVAGLYVGLDLPIVHHNAKLDLPVLGAVEGESTAMGDVSGYVGITQQFAGDVSAGARARLKVATGTARDEARSRQAVDMATSN